MKQVALLILVIILSLHFVESKSESMNVNSYLIEQQDSIKEKMPDYYLKTGSGKIIPLKKPLFTLSYSIDVTVGDSKPIENHSQEESSQKPTITLAEQNDDFYLIHIINQTKDTLYLFDSYLKYYDYNSKYLRRYDSETKTCKLSFLPMVPFLNFSASNKVILGDRRIVSLFQVVYSFKPLLPDNYIELKISSNAFECDYIKDFDVEIRRGKAVKLKGEKILRENLDCDRKCFEFAIYKDINYLYESRLKTTVFDEQFEVLWEELTVEVQ